MKTNCTLQISGPPGSGKGLMLKLIKEKLLEYNILSEDSVQTENLIYLKVSKAAVKRMLKNYSHEKIST